MALLIYRKTRSTYSLRQLKICLEALLAWQRLNQAALELSLIGVKRMRSLNAKYRQQDRVTDVLSFGQDLRVPKAGPWCLGEIVIAEAVARRQARQLRRPLAFQLLRLALHGLVHLQGWDHEQGPRQAKKFLELEKKYLNYLQRKGLLSWDGCLSLSAEA